MADLLHAFPYDFLYGSIAPDTSFAKKYVPRGRHSHFWHVGQETFDFAGSDALRAFGLGYLAHLAADTVAHNFFVPRQLLLQQQPDHGAPTGRFARRPISPTASPAGRAT